MAIYAIADLHLALGVDKPMDIFGYGWENYMEKIKENWERTVKEEDTVLILGDFCWGMYLEETYPDFAFLNNLKGRKILLKGNHDLWWNSLKKIKEFLQEKHFTDIDFLQNNSYCIEGTIICGTRGWALTEAEEDKKVLAREVIRLKLSLEDGVTKYGKDKPIVVGMHYPPISKSLHANPKVMREFLEIMKEYGVKCCVYGHLHGKAHKEAVEGIKEGIEFKLVSGDYTSFKLCKLS